MRHLDMKSRLARARDLGFAPPVIFDVGAADGEWARIAAGLWPEARIFGFEPNASRLSDLERARRELPSFDFEQCFLGAAAGEVAYQDRGAQTSLFESRDGAAGRVAPMLVLDDLLRAGRVPQPSFVKLDVQGYELEVLRGASECLANCSGVLMEVSWFPIGPDMPLVDDVLTFMRERSFLWYDVVGIYRRPSDDALAQMDFFFLREGHPLLEGTLT
jgi:FkbM family methyltransferase